MKDYAANKIRNFALVGHGSSGKTMLSEAMLFKSGEINRLGSIEAGSTVSDYHHDEHDRQISIHSSPLPLEWNETKFNLIDTTGYLDFIGETISSFAVVDAGCPASDLPRFAMAQGRLCWHCDRQALVTMTTSDHAACQPDYRQEGR